MRKHAWILALALLLTAQAQAQQKTASVTLNLTVQHWVHLVWDPSPTPNVKGYNILRATMPGGPYTQVNTTLLIGQNYDDIGVTRCAVLFYVCVAVLSSGAQTTYSNEVLVNVPAP